MARDTSLRGEVFCFSDQTKMTVLAVIDDLLFRAKLEAAAAHADVHLEIVTGASAAAGVRLNPSCTLLIVDLTLSSADPVAVVHALRRAAPGVPILGYAPHAQADRKAQATAAGCAWVWPRSLFVQRLPEVLAGLLTQPASGQ